MPRGDRTGPAGMGPMTGRGAGYCAGYSVPGYMNPYGGRLGLGFGWGRGRGRGRFWGAPYGGFGGRRPYGSYQPYGPPPPPPYGQYNPYGPYGGTYSKEQEKADLQEQLKAMEEEMDTVRQRINELDTEEPESETM